MYSYKIRKNEAKKMKKKYLEIIKYVVGGLCLLIPLILLLPFTSIAQAGMNSGYTWLGFQNGYLIITYLVISCVVGLIVLIPWPTFYVQLISLFLSLLCGVMWFVIPTRIANGGYGFGAAPILCGILMLLVGFGLITYISFSYKNSKQEQ